MKTYLYDLYAAFRQHPKIVTDSRKVVPGSIFFALRGDNFNGNAFAEEALDNGAAYAVIDEQKYLAGSRYFLVDNVIRTLQELAVHHRSQLKIPVIGITGTNGKTTTKELISKVLSKKFRTSSTVGNLNNHIGVPLSVLQIKPDDEIAVIEMGANHPGEIAALSNIAMPNHGLITNIGKAHLEGFNTYEGVIIAKNELYQHLNEHQGHVFVNGSDDLLMRLSVNLKKTTYGTIENADTYGKLSGIFPFVSIEVLFGEKTKEMNSKLIGAYNFDNLMAAACIGVYFGVEANRIKAAIEGYIPANNRSQIIDTKKNKVILDAYNANPTSMEAALRSFAAYPVDNKMLIIGDMLELGPASHSEHLRILDIINSLDFNDVLLVGRYFTMVSRNSETPSFMTVAKANQWLKSHRPENKTILVKGSRGIMLENTLKIL